MILADGNLLALPPGANQKSILVAAGGITALAASAVILASLFIVFRSCIYWL